MDIERQLYNLGQKIESLGVRYRAVLEENEDLSKRLSLLENTKDQYEHKIGLMEAEINSMKIAQGMLSKGEDIQLAKAKISTLVREIDRCIAMLNE